MRIFNTIIIFAVLVLCFPSPTLSNQTNQTYPPISHEGENIEPSLQETDEINLNEADQIEKSMAKPALEFKDLPVIERNLFDKIQTIDPSERLRVIIFLNYQPHDVITEQVKAQHENERKEIEAEAHAIKEKYAQQRNVLAPTDAENYEYESRGLSYEDEVALRAVNERHEALSLTIKNEISAALSTEIENFQQSVKDAIINLGGQVEFGTIAGNAVVAVVPIGALEAIAALNSVARIVEDQETKQHLNVADDATLVNALNGFWDNGRTGGLYDPAIVDSGTDLTHPALQDITGRENFYSWYLVAAAGNSCWDDVVSEDDRTGHGTHVTGIVSSYGSPGWLNHLGMAPGVEKVVTLKSGFLKRYDPPEGIPCPGGGWMYQSDAMWIIDRGLYATDDLQPFGTFNDDVDGLNLSYGGETEEDETDYSRFYDSIVSSYTDLVVTLSAGNSGPNNANFNSPACAYNPITVANVNDWNTVARTDDQIWTTSTRGPTDSGRRKPDIAAPGRWIESCNTDWETQADFINKTGTSMAAPMVLGVAMDLMDAGIYDELQIKALLINTAQKNVPGIDFEADADGWSEDYGWGYMNALAAYHHRPDVRTSSVNERGTSGDYRLFKGQMQDEGATGEGRDRATMVWNRKVTYNPQAYPSTYFNLSDLDLRLYRESDNYPIYSDTTVLDNVHQVRINSGAGLTDVVIKAYAYSTDFPHGGATETFALATEENFVEADPPSFQRNYTRPNYVAPNRIFDVIVRIFNNGDVTANNNTVTLQDITGITVSGNNSHSLPAILPGPYPANPQETTYTLVTSGLSAGTYWLPLDFVSNCYGQTYTYSTTSGVSVVVESTLPTSSGSSPAYANGNIPVSWTASDSPSGVKQTFLWMKRPGDTNFYTPGINASGTSGTFDYAPTAADGTYYFATRSEDNAGNWEAVPTVAETSTFLDRGVPSSSVSTPTYDTGGSIPLTFSVADPAPSSGIEFVDFWYKKGSVGSWTYTGLNSTSTSGTVYFAPTGDGIYYFASRVKDRAQNIENNPIGDGDDSTIYDRAVPTGSILIDGGAATTPSLIVTLDLNASDATSGVTLMRFSNNGSVWSPWEGYSPTKNNWNLSAYGGTSTAGTKTTYAQFRDAAGWISVTYSDTIVYQIVPPCQGDFDGSGAVDVADLAVFAAAFGSISGQPNYNPAADFDGSGTVDGEDLTVFIQEFGRTDCP